MLENVNIVWWYVWPCYRSAFLLRSTRKTVKLIWCVVLHHEQAYSIFSHLEIVLVWWIRATFFLQRSFYYSILFYFILRFAHTNTTVGAKKALTVQALKRRQRQQ